MNFGFGTPGKKYSYRHQNCSALHNAASSTSRIILRVICLFASHKTTVSHCLLKLKQLSKSVMQILVKFSKFPSINN